MSENYHWVCALCWDGREEKTIGWGAAKYRSCGVCARALSMNGAGAHYVPKSSAMERELGRVRGDAELNRAMAQYRGGRVETALIHHTLPCMTVTGCGVSIQEVKRRAGDLRSSESYTYDLSATTCQACTKACTEQPENIQQESADAGWLRAQGETFASLKELVIVVNIGESRLCGDSPQFGSKTRAEFVSQVCRDLERIQDKTYRETINGTSARRPTPAGGLCHDDAHKLIDSVRTGVGRLRAGQAWPDDARRVAADLETAVDRLLGVNRVGTSEESPMCSSGCGVLLPVGATVGGLCEKCMKAADGQRRNARPR